MQIGERRINRAERTRDISSGGVCFVSADEVAVGERVEYVITLSGANPPVRIRCLGKILRVVKLDGVDPFEVAATMERYQFIRSLDLEALAAIA